MERGELVIGLSDIFEGGFICVREGKPFIDDVLAENVKEVLKRHGLIDADCEVIFPNGGYAVINCDDGYLSYDFMVVKSRGLGVLDVNVGSGNVLGRIVCYRESMDPCKTFVELLDIDVVFRRVEK